MDIVVKMDRFQILQNVLTVKYTLSKYEINTLANIKESSHIRYFQMIYCDLLTHQPVGWRSTPRYYF